MSLSVLPYVRNTEGKMSVLKPEHGYHELAGPESYRTKVYGSQISKSLGLSLLPVLAEADIYAETRGEVQTIRDEAQTLINHLHLFAEIEGSDVEAYRERIQNVVRAADRALDTGAYVVIW